MLHTPRRLQLSTDATYVILDYLRRDPPSLRLMIEPFGSCESFILGICEKDPEKWPVFGETGLFESILEVTDSTMVAQEFMEGMSLYGRYANVVARQANEGSEIQQKAVEEIFRGSFTVCARAWNSILGGWKHIGETEKEVWRKAAESLVCSLVLLLSEDGGELLYLDHLACLSMPYPLVLHCWLFAPDSTTRNRLDPIHETAEGYDSFGVGFYRIHYEPYLATIGSDTLIKNALQIMKSAQDCVGSRRHAMQLLLTVDRKHSVLLPPGCEADLMDIILQTLQTGSDSTKCFINDSGNAFLDMILKQSVNPIEVLSKIFRLYDGARVFISNAEVQAQPRLLGQSKIILFSQLMAHIQTKNDQHLDVTVVELKSEISKKLSPVLSPVLERIRIISKETNNFASYGAAVVLDQLVSLGRIVGLYGPEE